MGRPKKVQMLQANDKISTADVVNLHYLTEDQINEALQPYFARGVKLHLEDNKWTLSVKKDIRNIHGKIIGSGENKCCGTRHMPVKDLIYSVGILMQEVTPLTPNIER